MLKKYFFIVLTSLSFGLKANAMAGFVSGDNPKTSDKKISSDSSDSKRSLLLEFDYGTSRGYQLNRKTAGADSTLSNQKYISPTLNYEANSGFFASMGFYKTPGAKKSWDEFTFGLGWDFKLLKSANVDASLGYTHYTYNQKANANGINPTSSDVQGYLKHDFNVVTFKVTGDYYFGGTSNDADLIGDLDHAFYIDGLFTGTDELSIDPDFTVIVATLNYYKGNAKLPLKDAKKAKEIANAFHFARPHLTNWEFSLPVNYAIGKFDFEIAWHYDVPSDLLPSGIPVALSEILAPVLSPKPYSYFTVLISWDFLKK